MVSESIEWFIKGQALSRSYNLAPRPPPPPPVNKLDGRLRKKRQFADRWGMGWGRSRNILQQECLVLYKAFSTLWVVQYVAHRHGYYGRSLGSVQTPSLQYCMFSIQNYTKMINKKIGVLVYLGRNVRWTLYDRRYRTKHEIWDPDIGLKVANISEYLYFGIGFSLTIRFSIPSKYCT